MSSLKKNTILFCAFLILSCNNNNEKKNDTGASNDNNSNLKTNALSKSKKLLKETITAHGGDFYEFAHYAFVFRGNTYQFKNSTNTYQYRKIVKKGGNRIEDELTNNKFSRTVNGEVIALSKKEIDIGTEAINSVIYFATLPHKLNDGAVNSKFIENTIIKNESYDVIEITFNKDGGGEDFDDEFLYWINSETKKIDYLAYSYNVNNGGVRFRSAFNSRVIDGVSFQDYLNYKADVGTPLKDLPVLYEANKLQKLSEIKTENIINLSEK